MTTYSFGLLLFLTAVCGQNTRSPTTAPTPATTAFKTPKSTVKVSHASTPRAPDKSSSKSSVKVSHASTPRAPDKSSSKSTNDMVSTQCRDRTSKEDCTTYMDDNNENKCEWEVKYETAVYGDKRAVDVPWKNSLTYDLRYTTLALHHSERDFYCALFLWRGPLSTDRLECSDPPEICGPGSTSFVRPFSGSLRIPTLRPADGIQYTGWPLIGASGGGFYVKGSSRQKSPYAWPCKGEGSSCTVTDSTDHQLFSGKAIACDNRVAVKTCRPIRSSPGCFHATTGFLGGDGSAVLVSELQVGDTIMVLEESARLIDGIPQEANVIGWARRPSSQPGLACTSQIEFVEIAYAAQNVNNLSPARASFDGVVSVTHSHFMHVRGSENNSTTEVLVLAGNITLGQLIRVWDGEEYAWGQVTNVTNFVDSATSTYVPITDRGTNFVMESGLIVPMDGQSLIDGVTVHRSYIVWMHNLAMNTKRLAPSIFWDSVFAPMLASESSILDGSCFETIAFFNHLVTALRANDKEGLWLVADPAKSEEFLEWVADHMHELVGLTQTSQDWWVIPASRAAASLALRAVSQVALMTSQSSTPIKLDALYDATVWEEQGQARKCAWNHIGALDFDCGGQSYVEDAMNVQNFSAEFCCAAVADPGGVQAKATVADPVITVCVTTMTFEWPLNATQKAKAISLYAVAVAEGTNINASQVLVTMAATTGRRLLAAASYVFEAKVLTSTSTAMKQVESTEMAEITRLSFEGQQVLEPLLTGYVVATWSPAEDVFKQPAAAAAGTSPVGIAPGIIAVAVIVPLVVIAGLLLWWFCVYRKTSGRRSSSNQVAPLSSAPGQGGLNQRKAAADNR